MLIRILSSYLLVCACLFQLYGQSLAVDGGEMTGENGGFIIFMSTECPMCIQYAGTLRRLGDEFEGRGVAFTVVFPGADVDSLSVKHFMRKYNVPFRFVLDPDFQISSGFGAAITPEVFILDRNRQLFYSGSIDDWYFALGRKRPRPSVNYASDCLQAMLENRSAPYLRTKALGCFIFPRAN